VRRSILLCPNGGRCGVVAVSCPFGTETMRGSGELTRTGSVLRSVPAAGTSFAWREARVATTDRSTTFAGGRMPRVSLGEKLSEVAATWGAVWIGRRLFSSAWTTRADVTDPRPKRFSLTATTAFGTSALR